MTPSRRSRTYREEYRRRIEKNRNLPTEVARGHGPIPLRIARGIQAQRTGKPRALPVKTQEKYRKGIAEYERRYWGGLLTGRTRPKKFKTLRLAEEFADEYAGPEGYREIFEEAPGVWRIRTLR